MSSTVSATEIQTISKKILLPRKMEEKRLVRTTSLEKIRRFNSFICSQEYYVLPALVAWLRSSRSVLESSSEKTIFFFRSLLFSHFLYKLYQVEFRARLSNVLILIKKQHEEGYDRVLESPKVLKFGAYLVGSVLATEIGLCFYLLSQTKVPSGLVFLIVCLFYIVYLLTRSTYSANKDEIKKKRK